MNNEDEIVYETPAIIELTPEKLLLGSTPVDSKKPEPPEEEF